MTALEHLIFDLDGTLTDPRTGITRCWAYMLERLGRAAPPLHELERFIGPPTRDVASELLGTDDATELERAIAIYRERFSSVGLYENQLYPGIGEVLAGLQQQGFALWVCTSKPHVFARRILEHFALNAHFRAVYGPELDGTRADKLDLLGYLLPRESIDPARALMIGDRMHDIRAARHCGARSLGVTYGFGSLEELTAAGADAICDSVAELPSAIARS
jgi:phosphoglycolate phosphatase